MEKLLKTEEVAQRWQCSKDYVLNQIPKGLEVIRLGQKDFRFDIKDVMNYEMYLKNVQSTMTRMNNAAAQRRATIVKFTNDYKII